MEEQPIKITQAEAFGRKKLGNLTVEGTRFFGRPNFAGEEDQFRDSSRKFTIIIPNEAADELRGIGWNVKTKTHDKEGNELEVPISSLKVKLNFRPDPEAPNDITREKGPDIWVIMGENREKLNSRTVPMMDRSRILQLDLEVRAWEYDPEDAPNQFSARLVQMVATIQPSLLDSKYGGLR